MDDDDASLCIHVAHFGERRSGDAALIGDAIERTLKRFQRDRAGISVALVDDARIADLNERFLGHLGPTDCITFNLGDSPDVLEGEIVISHETAARAAASRGHDTLAEVLLCAVHGTLHLLGLDDASEGDAARMHVIEDEVLAEMGIGPVYTVNER